MDLIPSPFPVHITKGGAAIEGDSRALPMSQVSVFLDLIPSPLWLDSSVLGDGRVLCDAGAL
jgi:hypothetical protein